MLFFNRSIDLKHKFVIDFTNRAIASLWGGNFNLGAIGFESWSIRKRIARRRVRGLKVAPIGLTLSVIRRIIPTAGLRGILPFNPALPVKPPPERRDPAAANNYLELEAAQKL
ncbi:MAG: hypothetical protein ACFBSE_05585, partial [Prochloraceae cyanobacterium]